MDMQDPVKKVAAIHDLAGFGRSSLCAVIPTLAAMGVQVCPIPTAILSTHSGGFTGYTFHDLTDYMPAHIAHWKELGLTFDCIYSGFLGSPRQIEIVSEVIDTFRRPDTLVVVDPVLGDDGVLYSSIPESMVAEMRRLIAKADIVVPNYTEAARLLGRPQPGSLPREEVKAWLRALSDMGPGTVLMTSAPDGERPEMVNVAAYQRQTDSFWKVAAKRLPDSYPGTGDTFASVMIGGLLQGDSLPHAIVRAVQFISRCIQDSCVYDYPHRDGVLLERELPLLQGGSLAGEYEEL